MRPSRTRRRHFAGLLIATLAFAAWFAPPPAQAQTPSAGAAETTSPVAQARELYEQGQFTQAIELLRGAISSGQVAGRDLIAARELIARSLVRAGDRVEAKEAFKALLYLSPSYRPAPGSMPPDELEVLELARRESTSEQIEAGQRIPASLSFTVGAGSGDNKDMAEVAVDVGNGNDKFDAKTEFGGAVRFPVTSRISIEIELQRFRATNIDQEDPPNEYEITALPLSVSGIYPLLRRPHWRVQVFGGVGSLLAATTTISVHTSDGVLQLSDDKNSFYGHAGLEGEYLIFSRLAIHGRLLGRVAKATDLYEEQELLSVLRGREIDFSGFGAHIGLRAYVGY